MSTERTITEQLVIDRLCRRLRMDERQLLGHLAVERGTDLLTPEDVTHVLRAAQGHNDRGTYTVPPPVPAAVWAAYIEQLETTARAAGITLPPAPR